MATTTNYGWTTPNDTDLVKNGASAMRTLGTAVDTTLGTALNNKLHAGLVLLKTQTIGTGVSSVTVTGAFNATYDNYKIIISGGTGTTNIPLQLRFGAANTNYNSNLIYTLYTSNSVLGLATNGGTLFSYMGLYNTNQGYADIEIKGPFNANRFTVVSAPYYGISEYGWSGGVHAVNQSHTDFTLYCPTGTITGGSIAVYGYAKD